MKIYDILTQLKQQTDNNFIQSSERRKTAILPKRTWIQKNPRLFSIIFITTSLLAFFSKPIYDCFIADQLPPPPGLDSSKKNSH